MELIVIVSFPILAAIIAMPIYAKNLSKNTFQCKHCEKEFNVNWKKLVFAVHANDEYSVECPCCNKKECIIQKSKGD